MAIRNRGIAPENTLKFLRTETSPSCLHCTREYFNENDMEMAWPASEGIWSLCNLYLGCTWNFSEELGLWGVMLRSHKFSCVVFS